MNTPNIMYKLRTVLPPIVIVVGKVTRKPAGVDGRALALSAYSPINCS